MKHQRQDHWRRMERHGNAWFLVTLAILIALSFASAATLPIAENAAQHSGAART